MKRIAFVVAALFALPALAQELPPLPKVANAQVRLNALAAKHVRKVAAQPMPGLGTMPGDSSVYKTNVVRVSTDRTEVINVSGLLPNRIATPFANPQSIDNQSEDFEVQAVGQSLYVTMKSDKPVALYVTGDKPNDPVISLTLVPKNLPAQTVTLQLDKPTTGVNGEASDGSEQAPDSNVYTDKLRYVLRQLAIGKVPEGFSEGALPRSVARMGQVVAYPLTRYSGPSYDIFRYRIEAVADNVELGEDAFYSAGVRAVAFFPNASLHRGESTEVFVVSDKTESN
ncbi:type-F conjugative transfer system secretin TraK (plasmid) [Burkholderia vietnamiensis]|uniref:Putative transfer protein TraK n=1 Tax=Burkholderia vietnamiensis (strain G4 / LMG 22486) TaxID=269482 RepID=A4JTP3_BURVG|nr:putative transfer protein TraK [Burkholderia vietnamiensis G4]MCB4350194.1 type-F conjugative transfer system secretin TraK [Burkholderia vietnamiensis]